MLIILHSSHIFFIVSEATTDNTSSPEEAKFISQSCQQAYQAKKKENSQRVVNLVNSNFTEGFVPLGPGHVELISLF